MGVPAYMLGEMTRLSPSPAVTPVDIISSHRLPSVSMGKSVPTDDPVIDVGGYMLGEIGPSNSERSKWRFGLFFAEIHNGAIGGSGDFGGSSGRERSENEWLSMSRGLRCGRGAGRGLLTLRIFCG